MNEIDRALKRIGHGELRVILREGRIEKIPPQTIKKRHKDNIEEIVVIHEDIKEE